MTINLNDWIRFHGTFDADPNRKVSKVEFQVEAKDAVVSTDGVNRLPIYFTDMQFQAGDNLTGWIPRTEEMLDHLTWTHDENLYVASPNRFEGESPTIYQNVEYRWYNIVGRGHTVVTIPNYYPEDWDVPILPTGIDITLFPKESFDVLRISTSSGVLLPEEQQKYKLEGGIYQEIKQKYEEVKNMQVYSDLDKERKEQEISNWVNIIQPLFDKHPIHYRYTREFWIDGATAGTEIKVHATTRTATLGGNTIKIVGEDSFDINGSPMPIDRKKFLLAPKGTTTFRIEFYKQVEKEITTFDMQSDGSYKKVRKAFKYLEDVGIGFYGTAGFYQWTYGRSRI
ncbi:hypothetical protein [Terrihalobacillus insolitus]|uniref:hypothetical protein n=1 Tax=Terrihalobacillus insolitus TaxID=2950438 RepID=UPI0023410709|nr:hypothetical protein [Terrihalobacillus insolitus]MDC3413953.1 hypothetical protein [Terrihalobacillus insolitus]